MYVSEAYIDLILQKIHYISLIYGIYFLRDASFVFYLVGNEATTVKLNWWRWYSEILAKQKSFLLKRGRGNVSSFLNDLLQHQ